jgi:hypothetical protein
MAWLISVLASQWSDTNSFQKVSSLIPTNFLLKNTLCHNHSQSLHDEIDHVLYVINDMNSFTDICTVVNFEIIM